MQGMGYRQYKDYYTNNKSLKEFINNWVLAEQKYAKRQLIWFKKDKRINWFDISDSGFERIVEKRIQSWYYEVGKITMIYPLSPVLHVKREGYIFTNFHPDKIGTQVL
jgi:hypothetical protein